MKHFLLIFVMALAACGGEQAAPASETPIEGIRITEQELDLSSEVVSISHRPFTIVMLGDSLTAGYGLDSADALPEQLSDIFTRNGFDVKMVNAGVSGDTTSGGLARYDWSVKSADPDMLIIALGANDFMSGMSPGAAKANLAAIIERAQADNVAVILASVEPGDLSQLDSRIEAFANIYDELASEYDVPLFKGLLDGVQGQQGLIQLDGLHPTKAGVEIMAARMAKFVGAYLPAK